MLQIKNNKNRGWLHGIVFKFVCSVSMAWGLRVQTLLVNPCCGGIPPTKQRKFGTDVSLGTIFLTKKKNKQKPKKNSSKLETLT